MVVGRLRVVADHRAVCFALATLREPEITESNRGIWLGEGQLQRHFGSDQSVWRDGDWNGFVRIALAGLLAPLIELARGVGHYAPSVASSLVTNYAQ